MAAEGVAVLLTLRVCHIGVQWEDAPCHPTRTPRPASPPSRAASRAPASEAGCQPGLWESPEGKSEKGGKAASGRPRPSGSCLLEDTAGRPWNHRLLCTAPHAEPGSLNSLGSNHCLLPQETPLLWPGRVTVDEGGQARTLPGAQGPGESLGVSLPSVGPLAGRLRPSLPSGPSHLMGTGHTEGPSELCLLSGSQGRGGEMP